MSKPQIDLSADLKRLRDEGYDLEVRPKYLLVKSVPYVNAKKEVRRGTLVAELVWAGDVTAPPKDHVIHFIGDQPCHANGDALAEIENAHERKEIEPGLWIDHTFSAKPTEGAFPDFYRKIARYELILSSPARTIDPTATARVFNPIECSEDESVFNYFDTASSRAGISTVSRKLEIGKVAIVGLGGTGSYILDYIAKTPVRQIHLFDGDDLLNHNAFRAPGAATIEELRSKLKKVHYLQARYAAMRREIVPHDFFITATTVDHLQGMDYVFLSMDGGPDKKLAVQRLLEWQVPFIDVGMGLELTNDAIEGMATVTGCTSQKCGHAMTRISFVDGGGENDYSRNIQIAELNALNAALAVIRWKKWLGFYHDFQHEHFCTYIVDGNKLANEECA